MGLLEHFPNNLNLSRGFWAKKSGFQIVFFFVLLAIFVSLIVISARFQATGSQPTFYVSTEGNDNNPGTLELPFATLGRAQTAVRQAGDNDAKVFVREGTYWLSQSLNLTSQDAGGPDEPNMWVNYPGERPVIKGSLKLTSLTEPSPNVYQANLAGTAAESVGVSNVFFNNSRLVPARLPNWQINNNNEDPYLGSFFFTATDQPASRTIVKYRSEDASLIDALASESNLKMVIDNWMNIWGWRYTRNISSIDTQTRQITLDADLPNGDILPGQRFWIEGGPSVLTPGEFHYNPTTKNLLFNAGQAVGPTDEVSVPIVTDLVKINSSHLIWQGFEMREFLGTAMNVQGPISNVSFIGNEVRLGEGAFRTDYAASTNLHIKDNYIHDIENNIAIGIFGGMFTKPLNDTGNVITNNKIHDFDIYKSGTIAAILVDKEQVGVEVSGNEVTRAGRHGMVVEGNNHKVLNNNIWQAGQMWPDASPINVGSRTMIRRGTIFKGNYLHDPGGYVEMGYGNWKLLREGRHSGFINNAAGISLMLDDWTSGATVEENVIENPYGPCMSNHGGRDNTIKRNYFYNCFDGIIFDEPLLDASGFNFAQFWPGIYNEWLNMAANGYDVAKYLQQYPTLSSIPQNPGQGEVMINDATQKNIFAATYRPFKVHRASGFSFGGNLFKYLPNDTFRGLYEAPNSGSYADLTLAQWQALGWDIDALSLNSTDPLFENPPTDYTLKSNSAAVANNFPQLTPHDKGVKTVVAPTPTVVPSATTIATNSVDVTVGTNTTRQSYNVATSQYRVKKQQGGQVVTDWTNLANPTSSILISGAVSGTSYLVCARQKFDSFNLSGLSDDSLWSNEGCSSAISYIVAPAGTTGGSQTPTGQSTPLPAKRPVTNTTKTEPQVVIPPSPTYDQTVVGEVTDFILQKSGKEVTLPQKELLATLVGAALLLVISAIVVLMIRRYVKVVPAGPTPMATPLT